MSRTSSFSSSFSEPLATVCEEDGEDELTDTSTREESPTEDLEAWGTRGEIASLKGEIQSIRQHAAQLESQLKTEAGRRRKLSLELKELKFEFGDLMGEFNKGQTSLNEEVIRLRGHSEAVGVVVEA